MDAEEVSRKMARLDTCRRELVKAKAALSFWSQEMRYVVDALADDTQFNFDFCLKDEV